MPAAVRGVGAITLVVALAVAGIPGASADTTDIAAARERANRAAKELSDAESRAAELEVEVADLQRQAAEAQGRLEGLRVHMRAVAVQRYMSGGTQDNEILAAADLNRQVQVDAMYRLLTEGDQRGLDQYGALQEDLEIANAELDAKLEAQRSAVAELERRRAAVVAELHRLEEIERQRQAEEARKASAASARRGSFRSGTPTGPIASGDWICPVQGPVAFTDSWGAPRSGGRRHQGVDMMAARGTPVVAVVSGSVTHRGNSLGGLSFHLYGDDGNYYYGTHLSAYGNGGHVAGGTVIGYVGDTGNAAGTPHLHFEIHPGGGAAINPYPTVARFC